MSTTSKTIKGQATTINETAPQEVSKTSKINFDLLTYNEMVQVASQNKITFMGLKKEDLRTKLKKEINKEKVKVPKKGSQTELILKMLNDGYNRYEVAKQLGEYYSFVHSVAKRYAHLITYVAPTKEITAEKA